jgi:hypothetical protein
MILRLFSPNIFHCSSIVGASEINFLVDSIGGRCFFHYRDLSIKAMSDSPRSSGIQVPYLVKDAEFGGKGLFITERVPRGTLIWRFKSGVNVVEVMNMIT